MAVPSSEETRLFYKAAMQRHEDSEFLLTGERTTGAVYLAGYAVECILKPLILSCTPAKDHRDVVASFRGVRAHDYGWLRKLYAERKGPAFPLNIARLFTLVGTWTTNIRYRPGTIKRHDAIVFVKAAKAILTWADGRL